MVDLASKIGQVYPIYIRCGLRWESAELASLRGFLEQILHPRIETLTVLDEPISDVYGDHWSVKRGPVPNGESPDEAVYLPGRNQLLVTKAAIWCRNRGVESLALGLLSGNPFPDSTPAFFRSLEQTLSLGMPGHLRLIRPFERLSKSDVMRRARELPLELTFSCIDPKARMHCGLCNKCGERQRAFRSVGVVDPTAYARGPSQAT